MNIFTIIKTSRKAGFVSTFALGIMFPMLLEANSSTSLLLTCANPSNLSAFDIDNNSATVTWASNGPVIGTEVEYGLSGFTQGTGTLVSGATDTVSISGLAAQSSYSFYVRTICAAGDTSAWAGPSSFSTVCVVLPYNEDFDPSSATLSCWTADSLWSTNAPQSAFGIGTGSAKFDFFNATPIGARSNLVSPLFTSLTAPYSLRFDHAYRTRTNQIDSLIVFISSNGGSSWVRLVAIAGGATGPLATISPSATDYVPAVADWATKVYNIPINTNRVRFQVYNAGGNNLYIDNVRILPLALCVAPTNLVMSNVTNTAATVKWTSFVNTTAVQYGPRNFQLGTGSQITATNIDTLRMTGLSPSTEYDVYVRSICGAFDSSAWTGPIRFSTNCPLLTLPINESFALTSNTRACWVASSALWSNYSEPSATAATVGSVRFNFFDAPSGGTRYNFTAPRFNLVTTPLELKFDHAYATKSTEVDSLYIQYSKDSGAIYTTLVVLLGGVSGDLATASPTVSPFIPTSAQWASKTFNLPKGVNMVRFQAVSNNGNMLYLDNIEIVAKPACIEPTSLSVANIDFNSATINWSSPPSYIELQYGLSGFTLGTGTMVALNNVNTYDLTALSIGTIYSVYIRRTCGQFDTSIWNGPVTFSTLCPVITALPYEMDFDTLVTPPNLPFCFRRSTAGSSGWITRGSGGSLSLPAYSSPNQIIILSDVNSDKNSWFTLPPIQVDSLEDYQIEYFFRAPGFQGRRERIRIRYGYTRESAIDLSTADSVFTLYQDTALFALNWTYQKVQIKPTLSAPIYIAIQAWSPADADYLALDDIRVGFFVTGIKEFNQRKGFTLFPNPTSGVLNVRLESSSNSVRVDVKDVTGTLLRSTSLPVVAGLLNSNIDISELPRGMYFIHISDKEGSVFRKVILE